MSDLKKLTDWQKVLELLEANSSGKGLRPIDEAEMIEHLQGRVKGQDAVIADVVAILHREFPVKHRDRPIANLLFLGPTGVGKTELAKAIAEYLFGSEDAMLRIDCPTLVGAHSKNDLVGHESVYQGSGSGRLTGPVASNPQRVILFDEVEKADPVVFDLFLPLMGEGRLEDQFTRKTVDFTKCIIILTSNAHADEIGRISSMVEDRYERENNVKSYLADNRVFKPEIIGRFDRVYVFAELNTLVRVEIMLNRLRNLARDGYGLELVYVDPELVVQLVTEMEKMKRFGARAVETILRDSFGGSFARLQAQKIQQVVCRRGPDEKPIVISAKAP